MSFFDELKRRNVFRVAIGYVITAWLLLQAVDHQHDWSQTGSLDGSHRTSPMHCNL